MLATASLVVLIGCGPAASQETDWEAYAAIVAAEDARGDLSLSPLLDGLTDSDAEVRALAVRGLGRLEDPVHLSTMAPLLADPMPQVRVAAAHALAQAAHREGAGEAFALLAAAEAAEGTPAVRAEVLHAAARVADETTRDEATAMLARAVTGVPLEPGSALGFALAADHLARSAPRGWVPSDEWIGSVEMLLRFDDGVAVAGGESIRRLGAAALVRVGRLTSRRLDGALADPDAGVRRMAVGAITTSGEAPFERARLVAALDDPDASVRVEALRVLGGVEWDEPLCARLRQATADPSAHVALAALDLLGRPCGDPESQRALLEAEVDAALDAVAPPEDWHRAGHALVALAALTPPGATDRARAAAAHPNPFMRTYAARVVGAAGVADAEWLRRLAGDGHPNVRVEAIRGLFSVVGHAADDVYRAQLGEDDPQLVMVAAGLLSGTPNASAAAAALTASLLRLTEARWETLRDARRALLTALGELPRPAQAQADLAARLTPLLEDYDPIVAELVAIIMRTLGVSDAAPRPQPLERLPAPNAAELELLARTSVVLEMARGGEIEILLRPDWAATNATRFARLVGEGVFDGLTFHRVVPNFVLQGGSPGANEYRGAPRYSRDEVDRHPHWAGTVGLSTRGRDTGDAQIFINLVDNVRLDHDYTLFGEVVSDMGAVNAVLEGDVIARAILVERARD